MAAFLYKAVDPSGKVVEGRLAVPDRPALMEWLRGKRLNPLEVSEDRMAPGRGRRSRIRSRDVLHFTDQLAALLEAGLPLARGLASLQEQAGNMNVADLLGDLTRRVKEGESFAVALGAHPKHFSGMYTSMVKSGEMSGTLPVALARLSEIMEKNQELTSRVKSAMTYPLVMACVMLVSVVVLLTFVVPRFTEIFRQMGATLPVPTRILLFISHSLTHWWWVYFVLATALAMWYGLLQRSPEGREWLDRQKLRLPLVGPVLIQITVSRLSLTLSTLLANGVSILAALDAVEEVAGNVYVAGLVRGIRGEVRQGGLLSASLRQRSDFFPPLLAGMVATGEESSDIAGMLNRTGIYFRKESDTAIAVFTTLLEPVMIVAMGVVVGFIVMSILLPVFDMQAMVK